MQCIRERTPFPDFIKDAPELLPGLSLFYTAYWDLVGDRAESGAPIKWTAIRDYAQHYNFDDYQTEALFIHIREMDNVALAAAKEKSNGKGG